MRNTGLLLRRPPLRRRRPSHDERQYGCAGRVGRAGGRFDTRRENSRHLMRCTILCLLWRGVVEDGK
jgi:hypothetical protein